MFDFSGLAYLALVGFLAVVGLLIVAGLAIIGLFVILPFSPWWGMAVIALFPLVLHWLEG